MTNLLAFHLKEIRHRTFYFVFSFSFTFGCAWLQIIPILYSVMKPLGAKTSNELVFTDLPEFWYSLLFLCLSFSCFVLFPSVIYHIWCFLVPSLYQYERKKCFFFFFLSCFFYVIDHFIVYASLLPFLVQFFLDSQINSYLFHVNYLAKVFSYMRFLFSVFLTSFFLSQIPVFFVCLCESNSLSVSFLTRNRFYFGFVLVIIASLISPPDVISQCFLSTFLFFIYESCVYYSCIVQQKKQIDKSL